jgi:hypothetical protein
VKPDATARLAERYILAVILPAWMAAAGVDYVLHRRSQIESTSGSYESRLHVVGISLSALPVLAGLLCEIEAGALAVMGGGFVVHAAMTVWDIGYADGRRRIVPLEQHVHALLEMLPFMALSLAAIAHRGQAAALFGAGNEKPRFALRGKRKPIPLRLLAATIAGFTVIVALPFAEEYARCVRYERKRP